MSENFKLSLVKDYKKKLTYIFIFQTILFVSSILILVFINIHEGIFGNLSIPIINSSIFGFIGSLVYFSRKSYVYLITQKFYDIIKSSETEKDLDLILINSVFRGYYLYLCIRPLVGIVIGPILYMLVITGLVTFVSKSVNYQAELSQSGKYFIYIISFIGGHASSDILDRFSKLAKKIVFESK